MRKIVVAIVFVLACVMPQISSAASPYSIGANGDVGLCSGYRSGFEELPVPMVGLPSAINEVADGEGINVSLDSEGHAWTCAGNFYGQSGSGTSIRPLIHPFDALSSVHQISAGNADWLALLNNGTVDVTGSNIFGEAGNGTTNHGHEGKGQSITIPQQVPGLTEVERVCGGSAAGAIKHGVLEVWGRNDDGMLGDGAPSGEILHPTPINALKEVTQCAMGPFDGIAGHAYVLLKNGEVLASGRNREGSLGDGTLVDHYVFKRVIGLPSNIAGIAAGFLNGLAWTTDGHLYIWGSDAEGQLGTGKVVPMICGKHPCSSIPILVPIEHITSASSGLGDIFARTSSGQLYAWGNGRDGELGDGHRHTTSTPSLIRGLTEVTSFSAGGTHAVVVGTFTPAPAPWLTAKTASEEISLSWVAPPATAKWAIIWKENVVNGKKGGSTTISPSARSFSIKVKPGRWEVYVENKIWPHTRVAIVTVP